MALFKLLLKGFEFPPNLPGKHANFRFVFQLRHFDASSETWLTTESVSPGLTTYWECDPSKAKGGGNQAKYIRDGANPRFRAVSPWDQVVLLVNSSRCRHGLRKNGPEIFRAESRKPKAERSI